VRESVVVTGTDCRARRGEKGPRETPIEDRGGRARAWILCIMKPVQTNEPGGVLSSV